MPSALMHISAAVEVLDRGLLGGELGAAARAVPWCYRTGALLPDLPLFDRFWRKVALFLAGRPYPESRWGAVVHARGAGSLAAALLARALEGERPPEHLSLLAGTLTHLGLDRAMHVPVEEAVRLHLRPDETAAQLHESIENYQSVLWHRRHVGSDGLGSPLVAQIAVSPSGGGRPPDWLVRSIRLALEAAYGLAPGAGEVRRWAAGLSAYRTLVGSPAANLSLRSTRAFARERPWAAEVELEPARERGFELTADYAAAAAAALEARQPGRLAAEVGDGPLV